MAFDPAHRTHDVVVAGAGPAGLAIASALAARNLDVVVAALSPPRAFPNKYGAWLEDLQRSGFEDTVGHVFAQPRVYLDTERAYALPRAYARIDNQRLFEKLTAWRVPVHVGRVVDVAHDADGARVSIQGGATLRGRLVVDAMGHSPGRAYQSAYGITIEGSDPELAEGECLFMDWRAAGPSGPLDDGGPPSFLYAMALPGGRYFLEETALAARPAVSFELLERRLYARLLCRGTRIDRLLDVERCCFPLDAPIPAPSRTVPFGAAAALVHPASGFMLAAMLEKAPAVARAIKSGLARDNARPADVAALALEVLWPKQRRRVRALHDFGLQALLGLDLPQTRVFFDRFFGLPLPAWSAYLSDTLRDDEVRRVMGGLFADASARLRFSMMRAGLSRAGARVAWDALPVPDLRAASNARGAAR
jgi:lycopene beta-cyclase